MARVVPLLMIAVLLSACAANKDKDDDSKVAKLVDFVSTAAVRRLWTADTGGGKDRRYLRLVPAIANDVIVAADADGHVTALDLESGKRLWRVATRHKISGAVAAGGDIVAFGTLEGRVVALQAASGEELWASSASSEILAPPAVNNAVVVAQTIDARVFSFNAKTGELEWSYDHLTPVLSLRGTSSPVLTSTQVICAFDNGQIVSFSATDGSRVWEARVSQPKGKTDLERIVDVDGTPVVDGGIIYAGSYQGNLVALSRAQGNPIWKKAVSTHQPLGVSAGKVVVGDARSRLIAYNAANGDVVWQSEALLNREIGGPVVVGQYLAVADGDGYLHLLALGDGSFAHRFKPRGEGFHAPMLGRRGKLYILSDDGKLSAYEVTPL